MTSDSDRLKDVAGTLLSAPTIARQTGHSVMCVYRALRRLEVKPTLECPIKLYDPGTVDLLKSRMRKPRSKAHAGI